MRPGAEKIGLTEYLGSRVAGSKNHFQIRLDFLELFRKLDPAHWSHRNVSDQKRNGLRVFAVDAQRLVTVRGAENFITLPRQVGSQKLQV